MKTSTPIRIVLADDHTMVREGLAQLLEESEGIVIVGQAGDGKKQSILLKPKSLTW